MKAKHTPGPWKQSEYSSDIQVRSGFTECALVRPIIHGDNPTGQRIEQIANARLIAAAPELLMALRFARRIIGCNDCGTDDVLGPIDEIIAKATGGQS